jgi:hypothetical protein
MAVLVLMDNLQIVNVKNTHMFITDMSMKSTFMNSVVKVIVSMLK